MNVGAQPPIDDSVLALLRQRIESFEQLEVLLLLRRHADRAWSPDELGPQVGISAADASEALEHLRDVQLAAGGRYAPDPSLGHAVDRLAEAYANSRLEIMRLMNANAIERVRTRALRVFSNAFLLGRKKDG